ncbi:MAG: MmcQ/YjbR family DNA-binding protein [Clostridia bacterium]|nr:MmcQ/YjbR family DNA-binding protein [Clostridia bacterium]
MNREELIKHISESYGTQADYPFMQYPDVAVFRHVNNKKWFAVVMNVQKSRLGIKSEGTVDILNLKCDPILVGSLRNEDGFYPAYHMSKTNWISAALDGSASADKIKWLIDISFELTARKVKSRQKDDN